MLEQLPAPQAMLAEAGQQRGRDVTQEFGCQVGELAIWLLSVFPTLIFYDSTWKKKKNTGIFSEKPFSNSV